MAAEEKKRGIDRARRLGGWDRPPNQNGLCTNRWLVAAVASACGGLRYRTTNEPSFEGFAVTEAPKKRA